MLPPSSPSCHPTSRRGRSAAILLFLALTCWRPGATQHLENDLSLLHDLDVNQGANPDDDFEVEIFYKPDGEDRGRSSSEAAAAASASSSAAGDDEGVKRQWGVADTEAAVGKLFSYPIPSDAFSGTVVSYQVKGLPSWLVWDAGRGAVEGVARGSDRGHHYVTVRARGLNGNYAKDVFAIHVKEAPAHRVRKDGGCGTKEDLTILSVVLDHALPHLTPAARVRILRTAHKFLRVNEVSLVSAPHDSDPLSEDSAIQAGPGSTKVGQRAGKGEAGHTLVQAVVGCVGDVSKAGQAVVERVEGVARSGDLERALGVPVLGWHVTQTHPGTKRVRRQVSYSGDSEDYYNGYYDYEYDYDDDGEDDYFISEFDLEPNQPESRVIPPLATPVFSEASATPHLPDRSRGVGDGSHLHFTPVLVSTPVFVPVKPTRVVVEASPTITYQTASPHQPSGPSRTPLLESSITTQPSITAETTTPLAVPNPSTLVPTRPLEPSVGVSTDVGVKNYPPRVIKRIQKLAWVAGHVYRLAIPRDTFEDFEDGDTTALQLVFKNSHGHTVGSSSWIQFNAAEQYIYALPLEHNIGRYSYLLEAVDSENKSITDSIMIHVQQPKQARNFNHHFTATFNIHQKYKFGFEITLDWQIKAVQKVAEMYGDPNTDLINVRSISEKPNTLTWTNISLSDSRSTTCPRDELEALTEVVVGESDNGVSREVKRAFEPEFNLKQVHIQYLGPCEEPHRPHHPQPPPPGQPDGDEGMSGKATINMSPIIRNQIDILNTTQGSLFRYKVPADTCYDAEDGPSSRLKMRLLTSNLSPPPNTSWLQFDPANQEFFGIPQSSDVGKAEYILECVDSGGEKVNDALFVKVLRRESRKLPPVEFSLTVSDKYSDFLQKPHRKARLIDRIGEAFGDEDARYIAIHSFRMGSVVVTWHNTTLPAEPCPNAEIKNLKSKMMTEDGDLRTEFVEFFGTEFNVLAGLVHPTGACQGEHTPKHVEEEEHHTPVDDEIRDEGNDYLLNFIIPAVIIAAMLLLAAVIACCLYRRRRYGKMTMTDDRTFVSKGIPIIFAEELDDRPDPAKSPVIMKEEKPPLPPPEYQRGSSPATAPTPPTSDRRRRPHSGDVADDAPSYQPPPPFTATNGASRHPRPNMPPTYRKPPTYVPP